MRIALYPIIGFLLIVLYLWTNREPATAFLKTADATPLQVDLAQLPWHCLYHPRAMTELLEITIAQREFHARLGQTLFKPCQPWLHPTPFPETAQYGGLYITIAWPSKEAPAPYTLLASRHDPSSWHTTWLTLHPQTQKIIGAYITIRPHGASPKHNRLWLHTLGHTLGLANQDDPHSIMNPKASETVNTLSDHDLHILHGVYQFTQ